MYFFETAKKFYLLRTRIFRFPMLATKAEDFPRTMRERRSSVSSNGFKILQSLFIVNLFFYNQNSHNR